MTTSQSQPEPASFSDFVLSLAGLPREIVHTILDDLPLSKILEVLSERNDTVNQCIYTHLHYKKLFQSPDDITHLTNYFDLFRKISGYWIAQILFPVFGFAEPLSYRFDLGNKPTSDTGNYLLLREVKDAFAYTISRWLQRSNFDYDLLRPYALNDFPENRNNSYEDLVARWEWRTNAREAINLAKAAQLNKVAELITTYPGRLELKKPLDPGQGVARPNVTHISDYFKRCATKALANYNFGPGERSRCYKDADNIQLVPYNRYLWYFLDMMAKYPPEDKMLALSDRFEKLSSPETSLQARMSTPLPSQPRILGNEAKPYKYPSEVAINIETVLLGLSYVYTGSVLLIVPRIDWPPPSVPGKPNSGRPVFRTTLEPHSRNLPSSLHRCPVKNRKPHDEREYEWLEAFLKVIVWMEEHFPNEMVPEPEEEEVAGEIKDEHKEEEVQA